MGVADARGMIDRRMVVPRDCRPEGLRPSFESVPIVRSACWPDRISPSKEGNDRSRAALGPRSTAGRLRVWVVSRFPPTDRITNTLVRAIGHSLRSRPCGHLWKRDVRAISRRCLRIFDPAQLKAATISLTIGFMWKLLDGEMLTRPPASSIARATTGPTAAIVVRRKPCRSVSSH